MVDYNPKSWFSLIFKIHKYGTVRKLLPTMLVLAVLTFGYCYLEIEVWNNKYKHTMAFHSLVGFVISLLLVFRTNTAYDRWWEGRKQWGAMVNNTRNLAIKLSVKIPGGDAIRRQLFRVLITNYVFAMKEHLREGVKPEELEEHPNFDKPAHLKLEHIPNGIAKSLYKEIMKLKDEEIITDNQLIVIDKEFKSLTDIIGACERIKKSPIPYSYNAFIKKFIFLYVISLPFGAITSFGYATIFVVMLVFYILASLELIAEEIEDPFGRDANDLPTDRLATTIQGNLKELF
jgi:putative membrane protein